MTKAKKTDAADSIGVENEDNVVIEEAMEVLKGMMEEAIEENPENPEPEKTKEQELTEKLQRLQAEFENFRKRTEKEKQDIKLNANAALITDLLKILDNFELSLKHNEDKGVQMIYDELNEILEKQGMKIIDTKIPFDPRFHEALMQEAGEENGKILEEFQKGYLLNDKLLRASKVKISTAN
jgi:molecular chaperone GrpE